MPKSRWLLISTSEEIVESVKDHIRSLHGVSVYDIHQDREYGKGGVHLVIKDKRTGEIGCAKFLTIYPSAWITFGNAEDKCYVMLPMDIVEKEFDILEQIDSLQDYMAKYCGGKPLPSMVAKSEIDGAYRKRPPVEEVSSLEKGEKTTLKTRVSDDQLDVLFEELMRRKNEKDKEGKDKCLK